MSRSNFQREATARVIEAGGVPERQTKHGLLYRLPNGALILISSGRSCPRALKNLRAQIARALKGPMP